MIRYYLSAALALVLVSRAVAQHTDPKDTVTVKSPETIVTGFPIEPKKNVAPVEHIGAATIKALSTEQDVAKIASITPSATFSSQSGLDIGYTRINLRGVDQNRISVMVNGIPQNGPEDQEVYWIDMPGLQASASAIDVQRGAGTAFYGPPAIGGSINVRTDLSPVRRIVATGSYGSYSTSTYGLEANSGLVYDKYIFYGRLTRTHTDGYRHSSWLDRTPYFVGIARYDSTMTTQFNAYGGPFDDGLNYYGLPDRSYLDGPDSLRRYNPSEPWTYERRPEEGEHFVQPHYELLNEWRVGDSTTLYNTFFYIRANGYFDIDGTWPAGYYGEKYPGFQNVDYYRLTQAYGDRYGFTAMNTDTNFADQIYRGVVVNDQWGWLPRLAWRHQDGELSVAGELRLHNSEHYGTLLKATRLPSDLPSDYHFYDFRVAKDIANISALEQYDVSDELHLTAALQFVNEQFRFFDQKPLYVDSVMASRRNIRAGWTSYDFSVPIQFVNPRLGLRFDLSKALSIYASGSITGREPRFTDYYNAEFVSEPNFGLDGFGSYDFSSPVVKPEHVADIEVGCSMAQIPLAGQYLLSSTVNGYYMSFRNEIVKSGQIDQFGAPVQLNLNSTVHYGIEVGVKFEASTIGALSVNMGISHNEITDANTIGLQVPTTVIGAQPPGVPSFIANGLLTITPTAGLRFDIVGRYNGGYYSEITNSESVRLDPYFVADGVLTLHVDDIVGSSFIEAKLQINNILDRNFAVAVSPDAGFFPAAPRNFLATISVGL